MSRYLWLSFVAFGCTHAIDPEPTPDAIMANGGTGATAAGTTAGASGSGMQSGNVAGSAGSPAPEGAGAGTGAPNIGDAGPSMPDAAADAGELAGSGLHGTGPGDWSAGDYPPDINSPDYLEISGVTGQAGNVRQYKVHVPSSYDPSVPTPLVFCIHGLAQDAQMFCLTATGMDKKSDEAGFIMVMPNGFENSWNAGTCCGSASTEQLDDVALFRAIFAEVGSHLNVDLDRVYATGLSNGGYMSYRLACEAADIFTAIAPGAAAVGINAIGGGTNPESDFTVCEPSRPVSVLDIHGTADPLIAYSLQAQSLTKMAEQNGCAMTTRPATQPTSAGDTTCVSYDGCPSGIELTGCSIEEGGHCWFGSPDCGTGGGDIGLAIVGNNSDTMINTDAAWEFFKGLSR